MSTPTMTPPTLENPLLVQFRRTLTVLAMMGAGVATPLAAQDHLAQGEQPAAGDTLATAGAPTSLDPTAQDSVRRDAWGQPKNLGLGVAEAYLSNFLPWVINELLPARAELKISQLSPRSWWRNIEEGWQWDDNSFAVNHFAHPLQGSMYYNGGRSNGYGYWTSLLFALAGSFHWECCGETHLMSVNDWVNTSLGGAAVGEVLYRTSSMVLDNQATGVGRLGREAAAFVLSPNRGFTRLVTGNASRVYANPSDPADHVPDRIETVLSSGVRLPSSTKVLPLGELKGGYPDHGYLNLRLIAGSLADLERGKPYDYYSLSTQINLVNGRGLGEIRIRGSLWHTDLARTGKSVSKFILMQDFDYENTGAFEQGGQGFSLMYFRQRDLSERNSFAWNASAGVTLLGGVKSELSLLADVAGLRERFREYDFGSGPGVGLGYEFLRDGRRLLSGSYRLRYLPTLNGSKLEGQGSDHLIQTLRLRGILPLTRGGLGLGADFELFDRQSHFDINEIGFVRQRANQWQFFVSWNPVRRVQR